MTKNILPLLRIGTRGSALALAQTRSFMERIRREFPDLAPESAIEVVTIRASGDYDPARDREENLRNKGGKGLFTKELEEALLAGTIDVAVHSMKDMPTWMPRGLRIAGVLERGEVRDAFVSSSVKTLRDLPPGASVGTSSVRRQAQLLHIRPDLTIQPLRGNVDTRLKKLDAGNVAATILAACGLQRLGLDKRIASFVDTDDMLPCPAQGIIGIEIAEKNEKLGAMITQMSHAPSMIMLEAERAMLEVLDGSCATPIGGLATIKDNCEIELHGMVAHPDGKGMWQAKETGRDARMLGQEVGRKLRALTPPGILPEA